MPLQLVARMAEVQPQELENLPVGERKLEPASMLAAGQLPAILLRSINLEKIMAKTAATKKTTKAKAGAQSSAPAHQPGQTVRVTIKRLITRAAARKTIERLFLKDKAQCAPLDARSANFIPLPKRRGGCIWTKRTNKVHPQLVTGDSATIKATPQHLRDLKSVEEFVEVGGA